MIVSWVGDEEVGMLEWWLWFGRSFNFVSVEVNRLKIDLIFLVNNFDKNIFWNIKRHKWLWGIDGIDDIDEFGRTEYIIKLVGFSLWAVKKKRIERSFNFFLFCNLSVKNIKCCKFSKSTQKTKNKNLDLHRPTTQTNSSSDNYARRD